MNGIGPIDFPPQEPAFEEPDHTLEVPPTERDLEQWNIPQVPPGADSWRGASSSPSDTPNVEMLQESSEQTQV